MAGTGALKRLKDKVAGSLRRRRAGTRPAPSGVGPAASPCLVRAGARRRRRPRRGRVDLGALRGRPDAGQGPARSWCSAGTGRCSRPCQLSSKDHADRRDAHEWVEVGTRRVGLQRAGQLRRRLPAAAGRAPRRAPRGRSARRAGLPPGPGACRRAARLAQLRARRRSTCPGSVPYGVRHGMAPRGRSRTAHQVAPRVQRGVRAPAGDAAGA